MSRAFTPNKNQLLPGIIFPKMERRFIVIFMIDSYLPAKIITILKNLRSILPF